MSDFLVRFATATWSLVAGLAWLWSFLLVLAVACLAVSGGIFWLDAADRAITRRRIRREVRRG